MVQADFNKTVTTSGAGGIVPYKIQVNMMCATSSF